MKWNRLSWRNYSIRTKTRIAVLLPMTALLLSCGLIARVSSQHQEANLWVDHTLQVRLALAAFERQFSAAAAESVSERQLTSKNSFDQARNTLSEIQKLTSDNPNQQRRIEELQGLFEKYTRVTASSPGALPVLVERQMRAADTRIRRVAGDMDQEEIQLLGLRTDRSGKLRTTLSFVIDGTLLAGVFGTLLATTLLSGNVSKRIAQLVKSSVLMREGLPVRTLDSSQDELGQLAATLAQTSHVLTERAAQIAESNWKLESVLRAATSASIIAEDLSGRITLFSTGASRLLGYRPDEVVGRNFAAVVQDGSNSVGENIRHPFSSPTAIAKQQEPSEYDTLYTRKDKVRLHVHVAATPLKELSGKQVGRLHVAQDITPRKLLEQELRKKIEAQAREDQRSLAPDAKEAVSLPDWVNAEASNDAERLSSNVNALNNWYETQGQIPNPHQETFGNAPRILIVDDFEPTRFLLRVYLQEEGYQLDFAADGKQALEQVAQHAYGLILMDVEMPQIDGYEAASRIRSWEKSQGRMPVPIVALSAQTHTGLDTAVWTSYIQKPVSKGQLLEAVNGYIEAKIA